LHLIRLRRIALRAGILPFGQSDDMEASGGRS